LVAIHSKWPSGQFTHSLAPLARRLLELGGEEAARFRRCRGRSIPGLRAVVHRDRRCLGEIAVRPAQARTSRRACGGRPASGQGASVSGVLYFLNRSRLSRRGLWLTRVAPHAVRVASIAASSWTSSRF